MGYVVRCLSLVTLLFTTACCSGYPAAVPDVPLMTVPEGTSVRSVVGQSDSTKSVAGHHVITWVEPTAAGPMWQEAKDARSQVTMAIHAAGLRLANVNYPVLSLPDFVTYTRALSLIAQDFTGAPLQVEAFGTGEFTGRWTLYTWQGPELPQHPDRPLVHRWIQTYALYDMYSGSVTLLLATIRGEVHE